MKTVLTLACALLLAGSGFAGPYVASEEHRKANESRLEIPTEDGVYIVGTVYGPVDDRTPDPILILLHDAGQDRHVWHEWARSLNTKGYTLVAVDRRGHGESTLTKTGKVRASDHAEDATFHQAMTLDVIAVAEHMMEQPGVQPHHIGVMGAGVGGTVALAAGAHEKITAVVALSPSFETPGLDPVALANALGEKPRAIYHREEAPTLDKLKGIAKNEDGSVLLQALPAEKPGMGLMEQRSLFDDYVIGFLGKAVWPRNGLVMDFDKRGR